MWLFIVALVAASTNASDNASFRAALQDPSGWKEVDRKHVGEAGEIVVRHKEVAGVPCLEGVASADVPPDILLRAAADIPDQPRWSTWRVPASVKLSPGNDSFDYFQVLDNPSPIADRYWFLHANIKSNGGERQLVWELVDPVAAYPAQHASVLERFPGAIMTRVNVGDWTFTPTSAGTRVRYRICTDAGGTLPQWVGRMAATSTLPTNLADIVKEGKRVVAKR